MLYGKRILAVVPARGGSKRVPLKNLHLLRGHPLIWWTARCIDQIPEIDRSVISTDNEKISDIAKTMGLAAPFSRPAELATDTTGDLPVLEHALLIMEEIDSVRYDLVVMLQPTSPLRSPKDVQRTLTELHDRNLDAVWTVSLTDKKYHPATQLCLKNELLDYWYEGGSGIPTRQELETVYHVNGVAYVLTRECILKQKCRMGRHTGAVIIKDLAISIDTLDDFALVEAELVRRMTS